MRNFRLYVTLAALVVTTAAVLGSTSARAGGTTDSDTVGPTVLITDLVSDKANLKDSNGIVHPAAAVDPLLVNPWGNTESPTGSPFWVADNNAGVSSLYNVPGANNTPVAINALDVSIPAPGDLIGRSGTPTGAVFNTAGANAFKISGFTKGGLPTTASAVFIFATEDGTIVGWNPGVNPPGFDLAKAGTYGIIAVDNSANPTAADGAVYKGLAIATDANGNTFLYATNFRAGTVEVYDASFHPCLSSSASCPVTFSPDAFRDPKLKSGYAPFNVALLAGKLFVTYAVQDAAKHDDAAGPAHGIVNTFDLHGGSLQPFTQHGHLNSPWGLVQAPPSFGQFAGDILIGNFGNGRINAFDPSGEFVGTVVNPNGQVVLIDGLWSLRVGNDGRGGSSQTIYFTAGPNGETDGLFGSLTPVAPGTPCGPTCI